MADISTGRQRGIVPFVDETTGRLPDQYLPQGVIDLQGDLEQAVTNASASATAAQQAVDGFGLEVGTTTTGEPGTNAAVEIQKNGTKYTANFTIPRGDKGEQASVARDNTLTGDGTSGSPLAIAAGNAFSKPIQTVLNLNDAKNPGLYDLRSDSSNGPLPNSTDNRGGVIVVRNTNSAVIGQIGIQSRKPNGNVVPGLFFRSSQHAGDEWSSWDRLAFNSEVNALTSRIAALDAKMNELAVTQTRLQALEARIKSLEIKQ